MTAEQMLDEYSDYLIRCCRTFYKNPEDIEDLAGEVRLKVLKKFHKYSAERGFKSWLFTIVRNTVFDQIRTNKRSPKMALLEEEDKELLILSAPAIPEQPVITQLPEIVRNALKPDHAQALHMVAIEGIKIADLENPGSFASRVCRARKELARRGISAESLLL